MPQQLIDPYAPFPWDVPDVNYELNKTELTRRVLGVTDQLARIADAVQGLPTRDDYDALMAENEMLRENIRGLTLIAERQNSSIRDLCSAVEMVQNRPLDMPEQYQRLGRLLSDLRGEKIAS